MGFGWSGAAINHQIKLLIVLPHGYNSHVACIITEAIQI